MIRFLRYCSIALRPLLSLLVLSFFIDFPLFYPISFTIYNSFKSLLLNHETSQLIVVLLILIIHQSRIASSNNMLSIVILMFVSSIRDEIFISCERPIFILFSARYAKNEERAIIEVVSTRVSGVKA